MMGDGIMGDEGGIEVLPRATALRLFNGQE